MKKNKVKYFILMLFGSSMLLNCEGSIDNENLPIPYPSIGGYENSDEIATGNLITKLSFETNLNDLTGNITNPQSKNVAFGDGVKGTGYDGSSSQMRYFVSDASNSITGLNDFTISFWMKSDNTVAPDTPGQGKGAQGIFSIVRPSEFWGGISLFLENPDASKPDRIRMKLAVENGRSSVVWRGQSVIANLDADKGKWVHVVFAYDSKDSKCYVYHNGEPAKNLDGFPYSPAGGETSGFAKWFADNPGGLDNPLNAAGYGKIEMVGTNGKIVFGTHQFETVPPLNNGSAQDWATSFAGKIDEFRIYNAALKASDISALYKLEKDGR